MMSPLPGDGRIVLIILKAKKSLDYSAPVIEE
jgi:hypothetical protein